MSDVKKIQDMGKTFSGDAGYCHYTKAGRGIEIEWNGATVVSVRCEHEICGYADVCKVYKRHPVGFVQSSPNDFTQEETKS